MDIGIVSGSIFRQMLDFVRLSSPQLLSKTPIFFLARQSIFSMLKSTRSGYLVIQDYDGREWSFGDKSCDSNREEKVERAKIIVHAQHFWLRLLASPDLGFAEAYMVGEVSTPDLLAFFKIMVSNGHLLSSNVPYVASLFASLSDLLFWTVDASTVSRASLNIQSHYDLSNDLFAGFLSDDMTYSCPIWSSTSSQSPPTETLEDAQLRKLEAIIEELKIEASDHVLEFGTGWGSFAIHAAQTRGCRVTSLTLSIRQKQLAEEKILQKGLQRNITVLLCDYRDLPIPDTLYDEIVAIEMLETGGERELENFWSRVDQLLKPEGGRCCIQSTIVPETRYSNPFPKGEGFITRYIFPGSHGPSTTRVLQAVKSGAKDRLDVLTIREIGIHYARAMRCWRDNFEANWEKKIKLALRTEFPNMSENDMDIFHRRYSYFFVYGEAGFATGYTQVKMITLSRRITAAIP